jgi:septal ring factor EnvC (AmiA/AmiB activator)
VEEACESEAEKQKRIATVEKGVVAAFRAAVRHLGEEEARLLFARAVRRPKRGPGKTLAADRNARLLKEYDIALRRGESVAALAKRLHAADGKPRELGATPGAIQTQIRKLVKERKKRERDAAFEARQWRMATRNEPPSLLAAATSEK